MSVWATFPIDEGLRQPFRIRFRQQTQLHSRIAKLWIHGAKVWVKQPEAIHLSMPISGTLASADGRTVTLSTLELPNCRSLAW
jgi:hypothetical protein